jgi:hypothetical protein
MFVELTHQEANRRHPKEYRDLIEQKRNSKAAGAQQEFEKFKIGYDIAVRIAVRVEGHSLGGMLAQLGQPRQEKTISEKLADYRKNASVCLTANYKTFRLDVKLDPVPEQLVIEEGKRLAEEELKQKQESERFNALTPEQQQAETEEILNELRKDPGFKELRIPVAKVPQKINTDLIKKYLALHFAKEPDTWKRVSKKKVGDYAVRVFTCTQKSSFLTNSLMVVVVSTEKGIIAHDHCNENNAEDIGNKIIKGYEKELSKHKAANKEVGLDMKDLPAHLSCPRCGTMSNLQGGLDEEQLGVIRISLEDPDMINKTQNDVAKYVCENEHAFYVPFDREKKEGA